MHVSDPCAYLGPFRDPVEADPNLSTYPIDPTQYPYLPTHVPEAAETHEASPVAEAAVTHEEPVVVESHEEPVVVESHEEPVVVESHEEPAEHEVAVEAHAVAGGNVEHFPSDNAETKTVVVEDVSSDGHAQAGGHVHVDGHGH